MSQIFADELLWRYVDGLRKGWDDAEKYLALFPAYRAQLEPLFHIADRLGASISPVQPSPTFAQRLKEDLLRRAAARPASAIPHSGNGKDLWWRAAAVGSAVSVVAAVAVMWRNHSQGDHTRAA
jgi:anti-sigma-K factor RskA